MADFIIAKNGFWWFRYRLPKDVRSNFGVWEVLTHLNIAHTGKDGGRKQAAATAEPMAKEVKERVGQAREANHLGNLCAAYSGQPYAETERLRADLRILANRGEAIIAEARGITCGAPQSATISFPEGAPRPVLAAGLDPKATEPISAHVDAFIAATMQGGGTTERGYRSAIAEMISVLGDKPVMALTEADGHSVYAKFAGAKAKSTVVKKVRAVKRFGKWAKLRGYIAQNPFADMEVDVADNSRSWDQFTPADILTMFKALPAGDHRRVFILLMLFTGLDAPSELEKLDRYLHQDYDQTRPHLLTRGTKDGGDNRTRYIPVHPTLLANGIEEWLANPVWTPFQYQQWFTREFLHETGIRKTGKKALKSFRSTFRSHLMAVDGIHEETANKLMGHSPIGTGAKHYGARYPNSMAKVSAAQIELFDKLRFGVTVDGLSF
jgi:integrase